METQKHDNTKSAVSAYDIADYALDIRRYYYDMSGDISELEDYATAIRLTKHLGIGDAINPLVTEQIERLERIVNMTRDLQDLTEKAIKTIKGQ